VSLDRAVRAGQAEAGPSWPAVSGSDCQPPSRRSCQPPAAVLPARQWQNPRVVAVPGAQPSHRRRGRDRDRDHWTAITDRDH